MIKVQGKLQRSVHVAFSGGIDSVAVVDFLSNSHLVTLVFFHHGNELANQEHEFVQNFAQEKELPIIVGFIDESISDKGLSKEEYWRKQRYNFFKKIPADIITCHHLDDCVETWVWSSLHGEGKIIPYRHANVYRPFRATKKEDLVRWANSRKLEWFEDETNTDISFTRNLIRNKMMPDILKVNPGIHKVVMKKVLSDK